MYNDDEKDVGIEAIDKAKSNFGKVGRTVYRGIRFTTNVTVMSKGKLGARAITKSPIKSLGKSIAKNFVPGTIRINGRLAEHFYNKNDDTNSGANAIFAAHKNLSNAIEATKDTVRISKKTVELAKKVGTHTVKLIVANPVVFAILVIFLLIILAYNNDDSDDDMFLMFSGLSTDVVMTDEESIDKYKELLIGLDDELNNSVSNGNYGKYDDVVINGEANTSLKEILSLFAVEKEQDIEFNDESLSVFSLVHNKMYKIETDVSTYFCDGCSCPHSKKDNCTGNCRCLGHSRLTINIVQFTFDEMLDILYFDQDRKDMSKRFLEKDYKEIYSNWGD